MKEPFSLLSEYFCSYYQVTEETKYQIFDIDAKKLFVPERLDLAAKYIYIEARESGLLISEAKELYKAHIEAFSDGLYQEPGNRDKNSIEIYFQVFDALIDDFKKGCYKKEASFIPVGHSNVLLDGAHRTACAAYFGETVRVVKFDHLSLSYGCNMFKRRLLNTRFIEQMLRKLCLVNHHINLVCLRNEENTLKSRVMLWNLFVTYKTNVIYSKKIKKRTPSVFYVIECRRAKQLNDLKNACRQFQIPDTILYVTKSQKEAIFSDILSQQPLLQDSKIILAGRKIRKCYALAIYRIKVMIHMPV